MNVTARELFDRLSGPEQPFVLDVRNVQEFAHWTVEGRRPPALLNVPYFAFVEDDDGSVAKVANWLAGRRQEIVVVCAQGESSEFVAENLRGRGIPAVNLEGGMVAWGKATVVRPVPATGGVRVWQVQRFGRGCLSYVVAEGDGAVVVDPHRGIDDYREVLAREGLRLRAVFDTHLHADHVSGAAALAGASGVPYHANHADFQDAAVAPEALVDHARVRIGDLQILPLTALHTPGHTPGSTSLLVNGGLLLTGDTVFVDGVGRPDLGGKTAEWAHDLYRTLTGRLRELADGIVVLPAHSSGPHEIGPDGTVSARLGEVRRRTADLVADEAAFVRQAEATAGSAPAEYARIRAVNLGVAVATEEEMVELELGRNEYALTRR